MLLGILAAGNGFPMVALRLTSAKVVRVIARRAIKNDLLDPDLSLYGFGWQVEGKRMVAKTRPVETSGDIRLRGFAVIYDPLGRTVWKGYLNGRLPHLRRGMYFVRTKGGIRKVISR